MFKNYIKIQIAILCLITSGVSAFTSSSYLIANTAIKLFDFEEAYLHFKSSDSNLTEYDLHNKLLILVHLNLLSKAEEVAREILKINNLNQEAWIVYLTYAKIHNNSYAFDEYRKKIKEPEMALLNYIFFTESNKVKKNEIIARSIFEVVQTSVKDDQSQLNYNFLLFYLSIANLFDPNFNEAYYYSAQIYQILQNYYKAESLYNKVHVNHNLYVESQKNIAINKSKLGFFKDGEQKLIKLIDDYSNSDNFLVALADLYRVEKKYDEATNYYSKIISLQDNSSTELWRLLYFRGICFERLSQWNLAEKDFLHSLKIKPNSPQVLNYLAYGWLERNQNLDKAMQMLQKAYKANPQSYYILDSLAWGYYKKNELQKAADLMEEVIVLAPGEAISLDHLGDIYFAMKRKREAKYFWKQALDLAEPEDMIVDILKQKLEELNAG